MYYLNTKKPLLQFQKAVNSKIYVDKSMLIEKVSDCMEDGNSYICITRPRRFGKTMNVHMLGAYFTKGYDSSELFNSLKIAKDSQYQQKKNQYNVISIDFSEIPDVCRNYQEYIRYIIENLKKDLQEVYPVLKRSSYGSIRQMLCETEDSFIFLLDEWDFAFYQSFMTEADKSAYLLFLKGLLKDQPYVELAYMTGVLPIKKYSSGSELNMFLEFNALNDDFFEDYFGMNEEEVRELCRMHQAVSYEELAFWYDGYYLSDGRHLFNPRSVNGALSLGSCRNYWTETGPMNEIAECIEHNVDEVREDIIKMVAGIPIEAELNGYSAAEQRLDTRDEILSAMVVYGFLSYHNGFLCIPNHELMEKYQKVLARESMGEVKKIVDSSKELLEATLRGEEEKVAGLLETAHDREIPLLEYNDENSLSCLISLCYLYARKDYQIEREAKSGKGYCDYLFYPKKSGKPAIILELKVNHSVEEAIRQIKEKNYLQKVEDCKEILLVGISYEKERKKHVCRIERVKGKEKKRTWI